MPQDSLLSQADERRAISQAEARAGASLQPLETAAALNAVRKARSQTEAISALCKLIDGEVARPIVSELLRAVFMKLPR